MSANTPRSITEDDGPFSYSYISILEVPGVSINEDIELFSFPDLNAYAKLTNNWDEYCEHSDRSSAIGCLLLTGFNGRSRFAKLSRWTKSASLFLLGLEMFFEKNLIREQESVRSTRKKAHNNPGCYLIYTANGDLLSPPNLDCARRVGDVGFGFDIVDGEIYRSKHKTSLHAVATSLTLLIEIENGSPDINKMSDIVFLRGKNGLTIYPKKIEGGGAAVITTRLKDKDQLHDIEKFIPLIANDRFIETAISLFLQSHRKDGDNLRAFIPAWSALELLVNRLTKIVWNEWVELLQKNQLPKWDRDLREYDSDSYRIRDRFYAIACTLNKVDPEIDSETFIRANNKRSGYYHRNEVRDSDLPTYNVRKLFRKYLSLWLMYKLNSGALELA